MVLHLRQPEQIGVIARVVRRQRLKRMGGGKPILVVRPAAERQGDAAVGTAVTFRFPAISIILDTTIPAIFNLKINHVMFVRAHVLHIPQQR